MRTKLWKSALVGLALTAALVMIPNALAQCALSSKIVKPAGWTMSHRSGVRLMQSALHKPEDDDDEASIVGMWHVIFTAQTLNDAPVNIALDNAIVIWHKDGTEFMSSSRPPQDGNVCFGVWAKTGRLKYFLNHIPWGGNDLTNAPNGIGNPEAGAQLTENIILSPDGNSYTGMFKLVAYNANKQPYATFTGILTAKRITTSTSITDLF